MDLLTWGIGINCLDPELGCYKLLAHLLDGQHRLQLMRNVEGKIIAGRFIHLLLSDIENPKPVLAVGKTYFLGSTALEIKQKIQQIFDTRAEQIAHKMQIPLYAILTTEADKDMHRIHPLEENAKGIFNTLGFTKMAHIAGGMDYDFYPIESLKQIKDITVIYAYQTLYNPLVHNKFMLSAYQEKTSVLEIIKAQDESLDSNSNLNKSFT